MPQVTFLPLGKTVDAQAGESLLEVALRHEIPISHACGGFCACTTCHVYLQKGAEATPMPLEEELDRLEGVLGFRPHSRLACQTRVESDLVVEVVNPEEVF